MCKYSNYVLSVQFCPQKRNAPEHLAIVEQTDVSATQSLNSQNNNSQQNVTRTNDSDYD